MAWVTFFIGLMIGGVLGTVILCLCIVSGEESRREEARERRDR